jgi:uncharacterized secreted protein with C-terminal beta-propeller domain
VVKIESVSAGEHYRNVYAAMQSLGLDDYRHSSMWGQVFDIAGGDWKLSLPMEAGSADDAAPEIPRDLVTTAESGIAAGSPARDGSVAPLGGGVERTASPDSAATEADPDFSDTNEQVEGVHEADIVKTDGQYIYTINSQRLSIVEAGNGHPKLIGEIPQVAASGQVYFEMYIVGDRLIALRQGYNNIRVSDPAVLKEMSSVGRIQYAHSDQAAKTDTGVDIFDLSDPAKPALINSLSQSGSYATSRMVGDVLYLVSDYLELDYSAVKESVPETYVPLYAAGDEQYTAEPDEIRMLPDRSTVMSYTLISGIDTSGEGAFISKQSMFGNNCNVYANADNMYLSSYESGEDVEENGQDLIHIYYDETLLTRVSLNAGNVAIEASAKIPGTVLNQFSMDEYKGVFRVVTTENINTWTEFNEDWQQNVTEPGIVPGDGTDGDTDDGSNGDAPGVPGDEPDSSTGNGTDSDAPDVSGEEPSIATGAGVNGTPESLERAKAEANKAEIDASDVAPSGDSDDAVNDDSSGAAGDPSSAAGDPSGAAGDPSGAASDDDIAVTLPMPIDPTMMPEGNSMSCSLFTLNQNLEVLGEIRGIAPEERVYSCRFMGDIGYFVTFRQVDPLFSVDLSNPEVPQLLSALKIPGFSNYLHPYAEGLLFGLGHDADENTGIMGSIKLSMFNTADPADVREQNTLILSEYYASEATSNHKAILVNAAKRLIAFPADSNYVICSYDAGKGFTQEAVISLMGDENDYYYYGGEGLRGLFIGDVFYVIAPNSLNAYDINNGFKKLGAVALGENANPVSRYTYYYPGTVSNEVIPFGGTREYATDYIE